MITRTSMLLMAQHYMQCKVNKCRAMQKLTNTLKNYYIPNPAIIIH